MNNSKNFKIPRLIKNNKKASVLMLTGMMLMNTAKAHEVPVRISSYKKYIKIEKVNSIKDFRYFEPIKWSDAAVCSALSELFSQYDYSWFGFAIYNDCGYDDLMKLCLQIIMDVANTKQDKLNRQDISSAIYDVLRAETTFLNVNGMLVPRFADKVIIEGHAYAIDWLSFDVAMIEFSNLLVDMVNEKQSEMNKEFNGMNSKNSIFFQRQK